MLKTLGLMLMLWPALSSARTVNGNPPVQNGGIWVDEESVSEFRAKKGPGACAGLTLVTDSHDGSQQVFTNIYVINESGDAAFFDPQIQGLSALGHMDEQGLITASAQVMAQAQADYSAVFPAGNTLTDMQMTLQFQPSVASHTAQVQATISMNLNGAFQTIRPETKNMVRVDDVFYNLYTEAISRCTESLR